MNQAHFPTQQGGRVYIIAEIGGNFTTYDQAIALVNAAASCGVDAVKLQTYRAETLASKQALFDMENTGVTSQFDLFKKYEIDEELHRRIFRHIQSLGLDWFSTPSHPSDADMLDRLGVGAYKVGSDDATNLPFLKELARKGKPIFLATGMCTLEEVHEAVSAIVGEGNRRLAILHAVTSYPTHPEHVNLLAIKTMLASFPFPIGYSDHTIGTVACLAAAALGATVLEKHFTLDRAADGPDHILSADPAQMKELVEQVRLIERMLGSGEKAPAASEAITRINNRKSLVTTRSLGAGHRLQSGDLAVKRPGSGIPPRELDRVTGRTLIRPLAEDQVVSWSDLQ